MPTLTQRIGRSRFAVLVPAACLLSVLAGLAPPLPTFVGPANLDPTRPEFTRSDLSIFVRELGLDHKRGAAVAQLLERYVADYRAMVKMHTPTVAGAGYSVEGGVVTESEGGDEQSGDYSVTRSDRGHPAAADISPEDLVTRTRAFRRDRWTLRHDLLEAVKVKTGTGSTERWSGLERTLVRRKTLPRGRLDGERTDLIMIVDALDLESLARNQVQATLDAYAEALHLALIRRNAFVAGTDVTISDALREGEEEKALSIVDREVRLRMEVIEVNRRYRDEIADRLDPAAAAAFLGQVRATSFPRVYRKTRAMQAFEEARRLDGLATPVGEQIDDLERAYRAELATVNASLRRLIELDQLRAPRRELTKMAAEARGEAGDQTGPPASPLRDGFRQRYELDARHMKQLYALLTPEQVRALPPIP